jgi:N-ethylmaleimide reductase
MFTTEQVNAWREITDAVHQRGGIVFAQLWHAGRLSRAAFTGATPVSASDVAARGPIHAPAFQSESGEVPRALDDDGIDSVIDEYRRAAENAADAGFDGVEMCCANGCLGDQFLHDSTNRRQDRYGGTIENRTRFLIDVVQTLASVWGARRVGVRLSPLGAFNDVADSNPTALFAYVLEHLQGEDIAYVHLMLPDDCARDVLCSNWRRHFRGTILLSGHFDTDGANAVIERGHADAIAVSDSCLGALDLSRGLPSTSSGDEPNE